MYDGIIIHYNEIAIKGNNRVFFENKLITHINNSLNKKYKIIRKYGLIYIFFEKKITEQQLLLIKENLQKIPGIAHFSLVKNSTLEINDVKKTSIELLNNFNFNSFKVDAKRSNKNYKYTSPQINVLLGEEIITKLNKKVDVKNPELVLYVEVIEKEIFLFIEKIKGLGGLPIGSGSKVICSLSGGIDSPVSAYLFMKRGCPVTFVHIYNNTLVKKQILEKIKKIVKELSKYQINTKLYIIPFSNIQKEIISNVHSSYRMIIYRRYMFKILNEIAKKEKTTAIITGDNVGQVASQTIENISAIYKASELPVLSPLITFDKNEIILIAKKINTFQISIEPYPDCCSYMISKHPKTKTEIKEIVDIEKNILKEKDLILQAISLSEIFNF